MWFSLRVALNILQSCFINPEQVHLIIFALNTTILFGQFGIPEVVVMLPVLEHAVCDILLRNLHTMVWHKRMGFNHLIMSTKVLLKMEIITILWKCRMKMTKILGKIYRIRLMDRGKLSSGVVRWGGGWGRMCGLMS